MFYQKLGGRKVKCEVCPRFCEIEDGRTGFCRVRKNFRGVLNLLTYNKPVATNIDPIEKKPLFHYAPGSKVFSVSTLGCNMRCDFCQNKSISYGWEEVGDEERTVEEISQQIKDSGSEGVAYTYTEPTVFLEYCRDIMEETEEKFQVFVSNGYMSEKTAAFIGDRIDAINIDFKGGKEFYSKYCGVEDNSPIKDALQILNYKGVFIETTFLIIPGYNDRLEQLEKDFSWIRDRLGEETPVHISRFFPVPGFSAPPTPIKKIEKIAELAEEIGLKHVYTGNLPGHSGENTYCPDCGKIVVKRSGYNVLGINFDIDGMCTNCGYELNIAGIEKSTFY